MDKKRFEINDIVSFEDKGKQYIGTIVIKDFGGSYRYSNVHCYDVIIVEKIC